MCATAGSNRTPNVSESLRHMMHNGMMHMIQCLLCLLCNATYRYGKIEDNSSHVHVENVTTTDENDCSERIIICGLYPFCSTLSIPTKPNRTQARPQTRTHPQRPKQASTPPKRTPCRPSYDRGRGRPTWRADVRPMERGEGEPGAEEEEALEDGTSPAMGVGWWGVGVGRN